VLLGALEQEMLEEVRQTGVVVIFVSRPGSDPESERHGSDRGHRLGHDPDAGVKCGQPVVLEHVALRARALGVAVAHATTPVTVASAITVAVAVARAAPTVAV